MHRRRTAIVVLQGALSLVAAIGPRGAGAQADDAPEFSAAELDFFETRIRPVLVEHCYECHSASAEELQAGLRLDSREGLLAGGDSGPAVVPGKPDESLLLEALRHEGFEMPPSRKLSEAVIADFSKWIESGAGGPRSRGGAERGAAARGAGIDLEAGRKFWCFQPVQPHDPPPVADAAWPLGDVDRFILAKLEEYGLRPAADADRATWLRRVTFDLIGLPPTLAEIDAFVGDDSPTAYEAVVDRLLASPHYGERWGRHWLDVARFAESSGGGRSIIFKDAWRYRDYAIDSFNADKPLDEFIVEQIAGDLLPHRDDAQAREHLIATGYLLLGAHNYEEQDKQLLEMDVVDEQLDTIGRGLLGMTVACARCHDHKFDPIPTADYYALAGILRSTHTLVHDNVSTWTTRALPRTAAEDEQLRTNPPADSPPPEPQAMAVEEAATIEDCKICIRGSVRHRGPAIPRGVLQVALHGDPTPMPADASGRRELAQWIASPQNPLTARVYVNRVWHCIFGNGLVRTVDNFGTTGELPSHPELLDALATQFVDRGWSTKRLVRELVLSHVYRMSAATEDEAAVVDPENRFLSRMNRRRLDAESLRDAMLTAAGTLDLRFGGRNISDDVLAKSSPNTPAEYGFEFADSRRSVYTPAFRNRMHELFEVFDFADQNRSVGARSQTTAAPQALLMLNSPYVMELARAAAERALASDRDLSDERRIERAFRETLGRRPSQQEHHIAVAAVAAAEDNELRHEAWQRLFQGLFGCVDFRYLD